MVLAALLVFAAAAADIDVVAVWQRMPRNRVIPARADSMPAPEQFGEPGFVVDRFWVDGQQVDVKHFTRDEVDDWIGQVSAGGGTDGYPMPVIALHDLINGVVLQDPAGEAAALRRRMARPPDALATRTARRLSNRRDAWNTRARTRERQG